jgi:hypothetical protein
MTVVNRTLLIIAWGVLGVLLLIPVGYFCLFCLAMWSLSAPDPHAVLAKAQPVVDRVTVALDEYHRKHGAYPRELSELVKRGFLSEVPELPPHWGTLFKYGPIYDTNAPLDFYRLAFGYHVTAVLDPGDAFWRVLVSDDPKGWKTTGRPDSMEDLVADRVLATYRNQRDSKSLDLFMSDVIGKADCEYLSRDRIVGWLGEGAEIDLPPEKFGHRMKGYVYQAQNDTSKRYCFVYKHQWFAFRRELLPDDEKAKYPAKTGDLDDAYVDTNRPVLDLLLVIRESEGRTTWDIGRECPESPRDKPSGRRDVVDSTPGRW